MKKPHLHWQPDYVAYTIDHFRDWLFLADRGDTCLYHIGVMAIDRMTFPHVQRLGDYANLASEYQTIRLSQKRVDADLYQYFASRTDAPTRAIPRAVATGEIAVQAFLAIRAIQDLPYKMSALRAIRDIMPTRSEQEGKDMLKSLIEAGLVTDAKKPTVTDKGQGVLS